MSDKACYCEVMDLIHKIAGGYVKLTVCGEKTWKESVNDVTFDCSNGWQIIAFNDNGDGLGYIDSVMSPDGRVAVRDDMYPRQARPMVLDGGLFDIDVEMAGYAFDEFEEALERASLAKPVPDNTIPVKPGMWWIRHKGRESIGAFTWLPAVKEVPFTSALCLAYEIYIEDDAATIAFPEPRIQEIGLSAKVPMATRRTVERMHRDGVVFLGPVLSYGEELELRLDARRAP